mmetsp:Transcript_1928/g.4951  ORF Transcript_1928/g.4951 Transcript_1928/m.4951 type:complete len:110 (-) Transcript_1928:91-420(-)
MPQIGAPHDLRFGPSTASSAAALASTASRETPAPPEHESAAGSCGLIVVEAPLLRGDEPMLKLGPRRGQLVLAAELWLLREGKGRVGGLWAGNLIKPSGPASRSCEAAP